MQLSVLLVLLGRKISVLLVLLGMKLSVLLVLLGIKLSVLLVLLKMKPKVSGSWQSTPTELVESPILGRKGKANKPFNISPN